MLENKGAGQSTMDTIEIPKGSLQSPSIQPPEIKAVLPPQTDGRAFKIPRISWLSNFIKNRPKEFKSKIFVVFLFAVIIVGVPLIWYYYTKTSKALEDAKKIRFDEPIRHWKIYNHDGEIVLQVKMGKALPPRIIPSKCNDNIESGDNEICFRWLKRATLTIRYEIFDDVTCYHTHWNTPDEQLFTDSFFLEDAYWYGGGEYSLQHWPIEKSVFSDVWFITGDLENGEQMGAFLESYWLSSKGVAVLVTTEHQFKMKLEPNNRTLSMSSPIITKHGQDPYYNYTICVAENITRVHQFMLNKYFTAPKAIPKDILFEKPIWSTFGRYRDNFSQDEVSKFAEEILQNNFDGSFFLFEKGWQNFVGDFAFNSQRFHNTSLMLSKLFESGLDPAVVLYPQFDVRSVYFKDCVLNEFSVRDCSNSTTGLTKWNNGTSAIIDPSYSEAANWYSTLVKNFKKETNISAVVFNGGIVTNLPYESWTRKYYEINNLTTSFIEMISYS